VKVVYFAGGNRIDTLLAILEIKQINVTKVCVTSIEPFLEQYKQIVSERNISFNVFKKDNLEEFFEKLVDEEILLSVGYRFIIPKTVYQKFKYAINIHPSLLPKYKGAYSGYAIIENGENETGITAHLIDEGIDTGDIIRQIVIPLTKFDTTTTMLSKVSKIEPIFVSDVIKGFLTGDMKIEKQPTIEDIIYNKKRKPEDSEIDETKSLISLYNKIRACDQERYPAYFKINGKKVKIKLEFNDKTK
jgi:methionyl-tRNA formyltransferase